MTSKELGYGLSQIKSLLMSQGLWKYVEAFIETRRSYHMEVCISRPEEPHADYARGAYIECGSLMEEMDKIISEALFIEEQANNKEEIDAEF